MTSGWKGCFAAYAQARSCWHPRHTTVHVDRLGDDVVPPRHVFPDNFLDEIVGRGKTHVKGSGGADRPLRIVAGNRNHVALRHRRNAASLADAAAVRNVGLNHGTGPLLKDFPELLPQDQSFTCGDGERKCPRHLHKSVDMLRPARLLIPIEVVINEEPAELNGSGGSRAGMQVQHNIHAVSPGFPHGLDATRRILQYLGILDGLGHRNRHGFHGREAFGQAFLQEIDELGRLDGLIHSLEAAATQVIVKTQGIANRASKQLTDRPANFLSLDVPKGLVNSAHGAAIDDPAAPEILTVHGLPQVFHPAWILPNQQP